MLMGEHAVLRNHLALCAAVNRRLFLELTRTDGDIIEVTSDVGNARFTADTLPKDGPFRFVAQCFRQHAEWVAGRGFHLAIRSELPTTVGLGSSAALVVALMRALDALQGRECHLLDLHGSALAAVRAVQGCGSGADVAASVHGGCVAYRVQPLEVRRIACLPPISVFYSGAKRPTPVVVAEVNAFADKFPDLANRLFECMNELSLRAEIAMNAGDWPALGGILNMGQGLMDAIGVNNARLSNMIYALRSADGVFGSKISGSGLGDCVVALGNPPVDVLPDERVLVALGHQGVRDEVQ